MFLKFQSSVTENRPERLDYLKLPPEAFETHFSGANFYIKKTLEGYIAFGVIKVMAIMRTFSLCFRFYRWLVFTIQGRPTETCVFLYFFAPCIVNLAPRLRVAYYGL